ncbi:hypothetical protein N7445_004414 [Penicillium cf. griseofulvum]|nr:hypothetical protein N7445_004414 [Penicillium cf. griseofulvum]
MDLAFFISHSTSAVKPVYTLLESSYYNCSPQPHLPLPLPVKEQPKFSLPSISTLFRDADGTQHAARKRRQFSPSHHDRDVQIQPYELPPPPPLPAPYAPPALTITSHPFPLDYYTCPPATASFQPVMTVTAPQMPQPHAQVQTQQQPRSQSSSAPVTLAWHRHYLPPSNSSLCQKKRGRYICRTCRKAFSCPFWLRTHFHSHTREKSFRCTHPGCGKSFSVRSNMNRHGRGQLF